MLAFNPSAGEVGGARVGVSLGDRCRNWTPDWSPRSIRSPPDRGLVSSGLDRARALPFYPDRIPEGSFPELDGRLPPPC